MGDELAVVGVLKAMSSAIDPRPQRALRMAAGVALATAVSYGFALPMPYIAPILTLMLLAKSPLPLPLKGIVGLTVLIALTTSTGLLLIPVLRYATFSGVLLIGLALFLCFRQMQRGGNPLPATFLVVGLTLIAAAGTTSFDLAKTVIEALAKGMFLAGLMIGLSHWLFPEPPDASVAAPPPVATDVDAGWIGFRAALVVLPSFLLAVRPRIVPPADLKSVGLGQRGACHACAKRHARDPRRYVVRRTACGDVLDRADGISGPVDVLPVDVSVHSGVRPQALRIGGNAPFAGPLSEYAGDDDPSTWAIGGG
jgi:hypothetical protein